MASFTVRLVERLRASGISDITVYAESFPAPKAKPPHIVGIISSGETTAGNNRYPIWESKRFMVTGSSSLAMTKAQAVLDYFMPAGQDPSLSFVQNEYACYTVRLEKKPTFVSNTGNIFIVEFILRFLIAA
ncbi:MAG: hypothetical protein V2A69_15950 [Pseudomonadota bacterium]